MSTYLDESSACMNNTRVELSRSVPNGSIAVTCGQPELDLDLLRCIIGMREEQKPLLHLEVTHACRKTKDAVIYKTK